MPDWKRSFPAELLSEMAVGVGGSLSYQLKCPICALKKRNKMAGLPPSAKFTPGSMADQMYQAALKHVAGK
jgi:hypothetical protein